ncbi:hypothetical protein N7509_007668 [Penicillium cosmopolitanum]|uniref:Uncharacterized protein n=1 Tax=Penicillium cosmopolitanum TaxID=1131564 RepID=A0A9W9VZ94_9EURO|nr:uncharacterized protein N7509_007668 [Penicillium cosmopolitanum]KAJ5392178.1 hypothetical protein N7509_007668 [Penicillium cosmopolitanum]
MNFPAPGAAQGRDLGVAAYEEAGVCADWGPWRRGAPRAYWQFCILKLHIQAHCGGVEYCGLSLFQQ